MLLEVSDLIVFFGRFHPLVVHLPIGFLLLAVIIGLFSRKEKFKTLAPSLDFVLLLGAISAALACVLGYLLSWGGDYDPDGLFLHQWAGILLAVLSFSIYWIRIKGVGKGQKIWVKYNFLVFWIMLALIGFTGHRGGMLTHGSEYLLQYAPDPLRMLAGLEPKPVPRPQVTVLDSADIFLDVVHPMIQSKCQTCHNQDKQKGELLLTNFEEMFKGGENGPAVVPGDLEKSLLYQRIILPENHDDYMPAEGKPGFDDDEISLIQYWIENEAPESMLLADLEMESNLASKFERVLGINKTDTRLPEKEVAPVDTLDLKMVRDQGFKVKHITPESNYLEVSLPFDGLHSAGKDLQILLNIRDHIAWMDLSQGGINDNDLAVIGQLKSLTRLNLANNSITDQGIVHLMELDELTYLNLYGTSISDLGLNNLKSLNKLQSLYLWQTQVSESGVENFKTERPDISVTLGFMELPVVESDSSEIES